MNRVEFGVNGYTFLDDYNQIWWVPTGKPAQLLADCNSLCGVGFLNTGAKDKLRVACDWHDNAYRNRAHFEAYGFDRKKIDDHFLDLMLLLADHAIPLIAEARLFYMFARMVGGIFYYRHPAYKPKEVNNATEEKRTTE